MRGQSEPPQHLDIPVNPRSGLRKGFPIKIAGHAIGGRADTGQSEGKFFSQPIRTRRNSASCFERSGRERSGDVKITGGQDNQTFPHTLNSAHPESPGETYGFRRRSIGGLPSSRQIHSLLDRQSDTDPSMKIYSQSDQQDVGQILKEENSFPKIDRRQNIPKIPLNIFQTNSVNNAVLNNDIDVLNNKDDMILNNFCDQKEILNGKTQTFDIDAAIAKMSEELKAFEGLSKDSKTLEDVCDNNVEKEIVEDNSLDDVITRMKNSLKAIKDGMSVNALVDLNREFTPLDLPPLR